jgi:hypothetical protein
MLKTGLGGARRVDNDGNNYRASTMRFGHPRPHGLSDYLLELVAVSHTITGRLAESLLNGRKNIVKDVILFRICPGGNRGTLD